MNETKSAADGCNSNSYCSCYCAKIPFETKNTDIQPQQRAAEISAARCEKVRVQKFFAWKLLEHALNERFGLKIGDAGIVRGDNGKWFCLERDDCFFSISHTEKAVAVAVSDRPCGVDIEVFSRKRFLSERLAARILSEREKKEYSKMPSVRNANVYDGRQNAGIGKDEYTALKWTQKESIFKMRGGDVFVPTKIDTPDKTNCAFVCGDCDCKCTDAEIFLASKRFTLCSDKNKTESTEEETFFLTACVCGGFDLKNYEAFDAKKNKLEFFVYGNGRLYDILT